MKTPAELLGEFVIRRDLASAQRCIRVARMHLLAGDYDSCRELIREAQFHLSLIAIIRKGDDDSTA